MHKSKRQPSKEVGIAWSESQRVTMLSLRRLAGGVAFMTISTTALPMHHQLLSNHMHACMCVCSEGSILHVSAIHSQAWACETFGLVDELQKSQQAHTLLVGSKIQGNKDARVPHASLQMNLQAEQICSFPTFFGTPGCRPQGRVHTTMRMHSNHGRSNQPWQIQP